MVVPPKCYSLPSALRPATGSHRKPAPSPVPAPWSPPKPAGGACQACDPEGKDTDKGILADKAFLDALVVKDPKRLIEHLLVKGALLQRIGMSLIDGLFCGVVIFQRGGAQVMKFRPHIFKIGVVVAPQHFHAVHTNGGPALMVGAFAVTGGKILDVAPECGHR